MVKWIIIFLFVSALSLISCDSENFTSTVPHVFVNEQIPLQSAQYKELWNVGGFVTLDAGYKGIIVYRESSSSYRAFERACSYDTKADCAIVDIDDSELFLIDKCCKSTFNFGGIPTGGPATAPLLEYQTVVDGDFLKIVNE